MKSGDRMNAIRCNVGRRELDRLVVKGEEVYGKEKRWLDNDGRGLDGVYYKAVEENKNGE